MNVLIKGASVYRDGGFEKADIRICGGRIAELAPSISRADDAVVFDFSNERRFVFPGLIDVHVHLREPGFSYKETVRTGTAAAARGGFTAVCSMPNLDPAPDSPAHLAVQLALIEKDALVRVAPLGTLTVDRAGHEVAQLEAIAGQVAGFSDDGSGVQKDDVMREAMKRAKALGKIVCAHCEDPAYGTGPESEWRQLERDLALAAETGCAYHVCHVSTKESVALIRRAKAEGLDVTAETAPHYLVCCEDDIADSGRFKMAPPIRGAEDRQALLQGLKDGAIDMIATDHAPHSAEEKARGFKDSVNGIVGLETSFPIVYTHLVRTGILSVARLVELMHTAPARRFLPGPGLEVGAPADLAVFDLDKPYVIDTNEFLSLGKSCPFEGETVHGRCKLTFVGGRVIWQED